ncbi:biotin transporter BioY [Acidicapsa ligni]|uniref:biotin transporter BioY n=1 Tax=Acidicapsa ligni TaxID=542300 RepID=UPI0021E01EDE|nr:biotin transporter BioY [Acidicapsa ligni]
MNRSFETVAPIAIPAESATVTAMSMLRGAGIVLVASALVGVASHISVPLFFTPVPVTLQPFAVVLLGLLLSPRLALGSLIAYLIEGAAGLPVFTPFGLGGMAQLLGPTGGYLLSYPLVALVVSYLWRKGPRTFSRGVFVAGAGDLLILTLGTIWLGAVTHATPMAAINHAVLPFLPGDALKVLAAAGIASAASRIRMFQK